MKAINKAIEIRKKDKYNELKYLILFVSGNMEEARAMQGTLGKEEEKKFKIMKEYLD